jgi:hypothetical protein
MSKDNRDDVVSEPDAKEVSTREEWFLLRVDVVVHGQVLPAGTPIRRHGVEWTVSGGTEPLPIPMQDKVCKVEYAGLPLHLVFRGLDGRLFHRTLAGSGSLEEVSPDRVVSSPAPGTSCVCVMYGNLLWPLEPLRP